MSTSQSSPRSQLLPGCFRPLAAVFDLGVVACVPKTSSWVKLLAAITLLLPASIAVAGSSNIPRSPNERPLPAFQGYSLDSARVDISDYIGKRLMLFFFNPEVPAAAPAATAVRALAAERGKHNFEIVGIAIGSSRTEARLFRDKIGLQDVVIIDDSTGSITRRLGLQSPVMLIAADSEGYMSFGLAQFDLETPNPAETIEDQVREAMRLPKRSGTHTLAFGERPVGPLFEALRLNGGEKFEFASLEGKPAVLIFFLHTCPHCHTALEFLKKQLATIPEESRPPVIGISVLDRPAAVRAMLDEEGFELAEVLLDPDRDLQGLYGVAGGVPDIFFLDKDRRIVHRVQGWREKRDPALARMVLAKISGSRIPMLLNPKGFTGSDVCGVCHELELESWEYTKHAGAYDTLVTHGEERNPECVSCHVVGFERPGGYTIADAPAHLEDVSCENCHGRGGPHLSKGFVKAGNYESICQTCHNQTHSLGFDYASFRPSISHARIASLSSVERDALGHSRPKSVLPERGRYVGSDACQSCHADEFATWTASPHGTSLASLTTKDASAETECLKCHTTGFGLPGGLQPADDPNAHADLARVGCESCHGPGAAHIEPGAKKLGSIISLGDKCDSCVILQICGGCHDDANDAGFEFEVEAKIDRQRHGTIEAGTGRPIAEGAKLGAILPTVETIRPHRTHARQRVPPARTIGAH